MTLRRPGRPWYPGRSEPDEEIIALFDSADPSPQILYDQANVAGSTGKYADVMRGIYNKMDSLKRSPDAFRSWTEEDGLVTFYDTLLDIAPGDMRGRVQILQQLGEFKFRAGTGGDEKKKQIAAIFAPQGENEDPHIVSSSRARRLGAIWLPPADSLLGHIIARPAQVGRVLSDRLNPANTEPFRLIGHEFKEVRSTVLKPIAEARLAAFERAGEIHIIPAMDKKLAQWNADAGSVGVESISLLEAFLLHEFAELVLDETQPDLTPLASHIVATSLERYLKETMVTVAVDDFFLDWPPMSTEEEEERMEKLLQEELAEAEAMFAEEGPPEDLDDDVDDLPMDPSAAPPPRKKKTVKKKVAKKKAVKRVPKKRKKP